MYSTFTCKRTRIYLHNHGVSSPPGVKYFYNNYIKTRIKVSGITSNISVQVCWKNASLKHTAVLYITLREMWLRTRPVS